MPSADKLLYGGSIDEAAMPRLVACCVDDTDDATRATSTDLVVEAIAETVGALGGCMVLGITRHQLLSRWRVCENCLFRRKVAGGLSCMLGNSPATVGPSVHAFENSVAGSAASI